MAALMQTAAEKATRAILPNGKTEVMRMQWGDDYQIRHVFRVGRTPHIIAQEFYCYPEHVLRGETIHIKAIKEILRTKLYIQKELAFWTNYRLEI